MGLGLIGASHDSNTANNKSTGPRAKGEHKLARKHSRVTGELRKGETRGCVNSQHFWKGARECPACSLPFDRKMRPLTGTHSMYSSYSVFLGQRKGLSGILRNPRIA